MLGLAGWHSRLGLRVGLTVCLFAVMFSIIGHDFNRYWGLLVSPLWCFGVVRFPASLMDLWKAARAKAQGEMQTSGGGGEAPGLVHGA
jgi:hypothetical protein